MVSRARPKIEFLFAQEGGETEVVSQTRNMDAIRLHPLSSGSGMAMSL
jgi:hypothetical protein